MVNRNWRLPAGVDELLPPAAWSLELVRRQVLDVFHTWGFEYVDPPIIEYLDALLVGSGDDMDLQTLKVVDQRSGRMLGVRADMTAQAVRIDAHSLPVEGVQRLCYAGNVVYANPAGALDTRVPLKAGAELFGTTDLTADAEVIALMLEVLHTVGIEEPVLVLGHMGIYQRLVEPLALDATSAAALFHAVQRKSESDIAALVEDESARERLTQLPTLMGERSILLRAHECLSSAGEGAVVALDHLATLADLVVARCPGVSLRFDLAELAGYGYHNGPVFSAYQANQGRALARGGRYDGIGAEFGRARPATGFDVSLKELVAQPVAVPAIWAPWVTGAAEDELYAAVQQLRRTGQTVVVALNADDSPPVRCDRLLVEQSDGWTVTDANLRSEP